MDRGVVEGVGPQALQIGGSHRLLLVGESGGKLTQRAVPGLEDRPTPIANHCVHEPVGRRGIGDGLRDLGPEVVGVCLDSVVTLELRGHDRGQQLTLYPGER